MDHDANDLTNADDAASDGALVTVEADHHADHHADNHAVDELLIEEISIDGMCGVY
jgi:mycofactocin precursor